MSHVTACLAVPGWAKYPRSQPQRGDSGILRRVCGSTHPSWKKAPPSPPCKHYGGRGVLLGEMGCPISSTAVCESTCIPLAPPTAACLSEDQPVPHRVNRGLCQPCLAALGSPAPTPYEPSWKAASLPIGWAGGWAWEAPRVSMIVPLPQHFQGLNSFGSCCLVGAPPELSRVCCRLGHQETHTLTLSLSCLNTHSLVHQYLNTLSLYQRKQTHINQHHYPQTQRVCAHPSGASEP